MADIYNTPLERSLPNIMRRDEETVRIVRSIDVEMQKINVAMSRINLFARPGTWTDEETDELAWQSHVDYYDPTLPIEQKRALVQNSIRWHRKKGTNSAVEEIITELFSYGRVEDWYDYGGLPGHFKVVTDNPAVTNEQAEEFIMALNSVKRLTAKLDAIELEQTEMTPIYVGIGLQFGDYMEI